VNDYVEAIINQDVNYVDGVEKNPNAMRALMRSLARYSGSMANNVTLKNDMVTEDIHISMPTIISYIKVLRRIHVIEDLPAWNPAVRSKTAIRTTPTRHFSDPSVAAAILRMNQKGLMEDFNTFGLLFESLCVRDLRVYAQAIDGEVFHYRDKNGLECDAVVQLKDGRWGAAEVKMGSIEIDEGAKNLIKLRLLVKREPVFLMVLTATNIAYRRADGVFVVPIGCLKD
jgi:predicted AAA+ superfamily ATPase